MRCFTDEDLRRGVRAVVADVGVCTSVDRLAVFLAAAQPAQTWPPPPTACVRCHRPLLDASGTALVPILISDRQWRCATCPPVAA